MADPFSDRHVSYHHNDLTLVCVRGNIGKPLRTKPQVIKRAFPDSEVSSVQKQYGLIRDFLAVFMDNPVRDITLDQRAYDCAIVGFSLDRRTLMDTMGGMTKAINLHPIEPDYANKRSWEMDFEVEVIAYDLYGYASKLKGIPIESLFGASRYAYFLLNYIGVSEREAMETASKRFGLPI